MTTYAPPTSPPIVEREHHARISRVPYLPGLDGMRGLAVVAVMIYHANPTWLPGGFLGVEMFFVISGYLITLLIIAERERTYQVSLVDFWARRARRLLPALFVLLLGVTVYTALFHPGSVGQLRGDVIAGLLYSSNWYQLSVGLGYTAAFDFAPLRHLWSLAVEEQFYLVWPLVMVALLGRRGTRKIADVSRWLFVAALAIALASAALSHPGVIGDPQTTPDAYWFVLGRAISKLDVLYIGTISRMSGILLGAALAMLWRPFAVARGPLGGRGRTLDVLAVAALAGFAWLCWDLHLVGADGAADPRLFRGGLLASSVLSLVIIAAISHPAARADRVLGNRVLVWIGVRSYGLYLFHWPVYQAIRELAGNQLTLRQFAVAMVVTVVITEASFRLVETPIRTGSWRRAIRRARRSPSAGPRWTIVGIVAAVSAATVFAGATLATADLERSEIADALVRNDGATIDLASPAGTGSGAAADGSTAGGAPGAGPADDPAAARTRLAAEARAELGDVGVGREVRVAPPVPDASVEATTTTTTTTTSIPGVGAVAGAVPGAVTPGPATPATGTAVDGAPVTTVPGDAEPVATTVPAPEGATPTTVPVEAPRSLGVVTDVAAIEPLVVPPADPPPSLRLIGFGDSVMLGSAGRLAERGFVVDAVQSRQLSASLPQLRAIADNGFLGSAVVVHLGTNGSFPQASLDEMMSILADVPIVVLVTGKADRPWIAGNNDLLRAMPTRYPNVTVLDWAVLGPRCPGDCFYGDDIHLDAAGQVYYADLVARILGLG